MTSKSAKFHQDSFKIERIVNVATDGQTNGHTDERTGRQVRLLLNGICPVKGYNWYIYIIPPNINCSYTLNPISQYLVDPLSLCFVV